MNSKQASAKLKRAISEIEFHLNDPASNNMYPIQEAFTLLSSVPHYNYGHEWLTRRRFRLWTAVFYPSTWVLYARSLLRQTWLPEELLSKRMYQWTLWNITGR